MQKKNNYLGRLKVSLHGMDGKAYKMMASYLELCCKDIVDIVVESQSQAEIIDIDLAHSKTILEKRLAQQPPKPIIVLSVQKVLSNDVVYVKKPVEKSHIVKAIKGIRKKLERQIKLNEIRESLKVKKEETVKITKDIETVATILIKSSEPDSQPIKKEADGVKQERYALEHSESKVDKLLQQEPQKAEVLNKNIEPEIEIRESLKLKKEETVKITKDIETVATTLIKISEPDSQPIKKEADGVKQERHALDHSESKVDKLIQQEPKKTEVLNKNIEPEMAVSKNNYVINNLLDSFLDGKSFDFFENSPIEAIKNSRKTVRYGIHSIKAKLKRDSLFASKKTLIVWVLNISSKGALIEMKTAVKLKGKVTLTIYFDPQHIFSVPAQVVRAEKESIYGLQFLSYQHELADYLVDNGHLFSIV